MSLCIYVVQKKVRVYAAFEYISAGTMPFIFSFGGYSSIQ